MLQKVFSTLVCSSLICFSLAAEIESFSEPLEQEDLFDENEVAQSQQDEFDDNLDEGEVASNEARPHSRSLRLKRVQRSSIADAYTDEQSNNTQSSTTAAQMQSNDVVFRYREPLTRSGFETFAEYLFWKPVQDNLEYALKEYAQSSATDPAAIPAFLAADQNGRYQFAKLDWSSGVRVGFGYTFDPNFFQLRGEYLYYSTSGNDSASRPTAPNLDLNGTFRENTEAPLATASSHANLTFQEADLLIARRFRASDQLIMKLSMGLTGGWFKQDWSLAYTGINGSVNNIKNDWSFQGGGGKIGLDLDWHFGYGISLFGNFASALVLGQYNYHYRAQDVTYSSFPTGTATFAENRIIPNTRVNLGFGWGEFYKKWGFQIQAGYELNSWYNLSLIPVASYGSEDGEVYDFRRESNVSFQGLTLKLGVFY